MRSNASRTASERHHLSAGIDDDLELRPMCGSVNSNRIGAAALTATPPRNEYNSKEPARPHDGILNGLNKPRFPCVELYHDCDSVYSITWRQRASSRGPDRLPFALPKTRPPKRRKPTVREVHEKVSG